jgi:hypothetical protein
MLHCFVNDLVTLRSFLNHARFHSSALAIEVQMSLRVK